MVEHICWLIVGCGHFCDTILFIQQQNGMFFYCYSPIAYFSCSIESNACFSLVFFILLYDYAMDSMVFIVVSWLLVLYLQPFVVSQSSMNRNSLSPQV